MDAVGEDKNRVGIRGASMRRALSFPPLRLIFERAGAVVVIAETVGVEAGGLVLTLIGRRDASDSRLTFLSSSWRRRSSPRGARACGPPRASPRRARAWMPSPVLRRRTSMPPSSAGEVQASVVDALVLHHVNEHAGRRDGAAERHRAFDLGRRGHGRGGRRSDGLAVSGWAGAGAGASAGLDCDTAAVFGCAGASP